MVRSGAALVCAVKCAPSAEAAEDDAQILTVIADGYAIIKDVDVRVIVATNRDLEQEIVNGNFREDLFNRLSSFHIHLPPLWEWREDIFL